jgi:hypothetical protein
MDASSPEPTPEAAPATDPDRDPQGTSAPEVLYDLTRLVLGVDHDSFARLLVG